MKYIIFEIKPTNQKIPIIFPNQLDHQYVAAVMKPCFEEHHWESKPSSAGFCSIVDSKISCSGQSETLNLKSEQGDSEIIKMFDYLAGL